MLWLHRDQPPKDSGLSVREYAQAPLSLERAFVHLFVYACCFFVMPVPTGWLMPGCDQAQDERVICSLVKVCVIACVSVKRVVCSLVKAPDNDAEDADEDNDADDGAGDDGAVCSGCITDDCNRRMDPLKSSRKQQMAMTRGSVGVACAESHR